MPDERKIPRHVAVILDGNGRWAKAKGLPRNAGHVRGAQVVEDMLTIVDKVGIKYFTVYAFSTENWNRPGDEVTALMGLLRKYMVGSLRKAAKNNVHIQVIGDRTRLDPDIVKSIEDLERDTAANTGLHFQIAINYGGRDEIRRAVSKLSDKVLSGEIKPEDITEETIAGELDTAGIPDPDLLIRTCGEQRISNFLLWQLAYTEFYFTDVAWPDFNEAELEKAIDAYNHRERRFGGLK
ncbi:MAG: isoprenyl transferase [Lachnospiraceae bacterium]|jgi:undecaprenyl diphosphate synthase|nr:isoprenyl transferase [Lachnospiraceae bacterium]